MNKGYTSWVLDEMVSNAMRRLRQSLCRPLIEYRALALQRRNDRLQTRVVPWRDFTNNLLQGQAWSVVTRCRPATYRYNRSGCTGNQWRCSWRQCKTSRTRKILSSPRSSTIKRDKWLRDVTANLRLSDRLTITLAVRCGPSNSLQRPKAFSWSKFRLES